MTFNSAPILSAICLALFAQAAPARATPIRWQNESLQLVSRGGNYARVARVDSSHVVCVYERMSGVRLKRSADNGKTWSEETAVVTVENYSAANPELLIMPDGDWLCSFNGRPRQSSGLPFTIATCRSADAGLTWSAPTTVYRAGTREGTGCWEPRAICAPDGSIQLYFANEAPYSTSHEQQITRVSSTDNGRTWNVPQTVSERRGARDGMPVPLVLRNGKVVMAIEDNGLNGNFKPVIIAPQNDKSVDGASQYRWNALRIPLEKTVYAGAPYLCQMPDGTTVLSAQLSQSGELDNARMAVWTGDENARDFADLSFPFASFGAPRELWNALWVKDADTVSALSSTTIHGVFGVWNIDGKRN